MGLDCPPENQTEKLKWQCYPLNHPHTKLDQCKNMNKLPFIIGENYCIKHSKATKVLWRLKTQKGVTITISSPAGLFLFRRDTQYLQKIYTMPGACGDHLSTDKKKKRIASSKALFNFNREPLLHFTSPLFQTATPLNHAIQQQSGNPKHRKAHRLFSKPFQPTMGIVSKMNFLQITDLVLCCFKIQNEYSRS